MLFSVDHQHSAARQDHLQSFDPKVRDQQSIAWSTKSAANAPAQACVSLTKDVLLTLATARSQLRACFFGPQCGQAGWEALKLPNGGGTEGRVRATLYGAFALGHELSGGKRLPAGGEVFDIHPPLNGSDSQVPRIAFRVVSTAFEGLVGSERFSLVHEALLAGASNGPLHGAYVQPTGRSEGEFDVIPPSGTLGVHHKVLIEARTHSEIGQSEPSP